MDIVRLAIQKPVGVTVGVLLLVMFGLIGLTQIPIQLTPTVDRPIITVETEWPGRSPEEVVEEITKLQEEELKNVSNLKRMKSVSSQGTANIELEFYIGADIARALQEVSDALRQVPEYPDEVEEPEIQAADGASENAIAWIIIDMPDERYRENPGFDIATIFDAVEDRIKPDLERIEGVAEVNVFGGREREVRVYADPTALAQRGLNHLDVVDALRRENTNVSAGTIAEGKRDYRVRLIGQYETPEQVLETVVAYRNGNPVYVKDVATVELGHEKRRGFVRVFGHPAIAMNVIRQTDANVVNVMEQVRARLDAIQAGVLPGLAPDGYRHLANDLRIEQVYDETVYIDSAIGLVTQNLFIGGAIAGVVLMVFLRSLVSTSIIAVAIPVSIIGTFLVMLGMGRTLNVISLAGLAFAVGMVVDNAIVVLENIYRRLQAGDPPLQAAYRGGREVWGAILASSLTTAAVFVPVLTIQEEAGQLFRDIALAIVAAVLLSLLVSVTVIPAATSRWLRDKRTHRTKLGRWFSHLFGLDAVFGIYWLMTGWRAWSLRPLVIVVMTGASVVGAIALAPPLDYLPAGNRNLVFGGLQVPPGLSVERMESIARRIETQIERMNDIVRYQLRKPAALVSDGFGVGQVDIQAQLDRLVDGLSKVYKDKAPDISVDVDAAASFHGDTGDFLEIAGNLLDNACKWCKSRVAVRVGAADGRGMVLTVADDGPGIPEQAAALLLQRGMRLDESAPGHGIGLAVVKDIVAAQDGTIDIGRSERGGAEIRVTIPAA